MKQALSLMRKIALGLICLLLLSGCMRRSGEALYSLPQTSEEYLQLQEKIDQVMEADAAYAAPVSGANRQSIQLIDIDGNGSEEALAFFRSSGERPLKICVFESLDGMYELVARIEGEGSSIESIEYEDLDGDGIREIVVGWQMGTGVRMLKVYSMRNFQATELMTADYSEYALYDMDGDGKSDITVLRHDGAEKSGSAEIYQFWKNGDITNSRAALSMGLESIDRIKAGYIRDGRPALFVEGAYNGSGVLTDILALEGGLIQNVSLGSDGISTLTRSFVVYCSDVDEDGVMDVPRTVQLSQNGENMGSFWLLVWYSYDVDGKENYTMTTYHNFSDGWYYVLRDTWGENISIRRVDTVSGARQLIFSALLENGESLDFLTVFTLTGENRNEWADVPGRIVLAKQADTIYAADITARPGQSSGCPTETEVKASFHLIYSEWVTGLT